MFYSSEEVLDYLEKTLSYDRVVVKGKLSTTKGVVSCQEHPSIQIAKRGWFNRTIVLECPLCQYFGVAVVGSDAATKGNVLVREDAVASPVNTLELPYAFDEFVNEEDRRESVNEHFSGSVPLFLSSIMNIEP